MPTTRAMLVLLLAVDLSAVGAQVPDGLLQTLQPRMVGPATMSGRVADLAVYEKDPAIFYVASASGGLLKTENGGASWVNVFEDQPVVSIGDVAINPDDPNEVWVGTGEANNRQSSSWGNGVYKSTDGGRSWSHMGLEESHHVGRIVVNPNDTDIAYVAAVGHLWGPNPERGVYRTSDGGESWEQVLAVDEYTGAIDLALDPANPKVLYAATYQRQRTGWGFNGGGPGSGIHKTVDGGRSWQRVTRGLPEGPVGRIGLDIYRGDPNIVYAVVEHEEGGVFRSEDKGESWERVNSRNPRPMYFSQIRIDPSDPDRIYLLGTRLHMSSDGGRTFTEESAENVHLDHHAFWIDPTDSDHLIDGNDGGVWVSRDRTETWEHLNNYPIGQFYNVTFDLREPYHVYGGMQDNATWGGPSAVRAQQGIGNEDWTQMLACDGMFVAVDPSDQDLIYTNCQSGRLVRYHRPTGERKPIQPQGAEGEELRWNWTTPIVISPHDPATLYTGANKVFRTRDRGHSWSVVSPDLTTGTDRDTLRIMGIPGDSIGLATHDGVSSYGNITALSESILQEGLLYVGTDDGKVHVTRDGGGTWTDLTAADGLDGVPEQIYVSRVWPSAFESGRVYLSFDGHRSDDFAPYLFVSTDYGESWRSITNGLPSGSVYVIKEDPENPDVLYVGTEMGLFVSGDRGERWADWPGVPTVAIYDLDVHPREDDLILGTHGRSILIIDDVSPLQEWDGGLAAAGSHLFEIAAATQFIPNEDHWFQGGRNFRGANPEFGAYLDYWIGGEQEDSVRLLIRDPSGDVVRELAGPGEPGLHRVAWDLRAEGVGPMGFGLAQALDLSDLGPFVVPGTYSVELSAGDASHTGSVEVRADPAIELTAAQRQTRFDFLTSLTTMQEQVADARDRVEAMTGRMETISAFLEEQREVPGEVTTRVDDVRDAIDSVRTRLLGSEDQDFDGPTPVAREVGSLKDALIHAQSPATELQVEGIGRCEEALDELIPAINALVEDDLPDLYGLLAEHGLYPHAGEPLAPIARGPM